MARLRNGDEQAIVLNDIDKIRLTNLTEEEIRVEFQYRNPPTREIPQPRWVAITHVRIAGNDEAIVKRTDLWVNGMRGDSEVRLGVQGPEEGDILETQIRLDQ